MAFALARGAAALAPATRLQAAKKMACMPWRAHIAKHPQRQRQVISTGKPLINRPIHRVEPFNPP
jgi:hypothetical protein